MDRLIAELAGRSDVLAACDWLGRHDEGTLALQCEIAAIAAPTGAEGERGRFLAQRMREAGLADVRQDAAGNVLGRWGPADGAGVVMAAHLDTVFPAGTDLMVRHGGDRLFGPGIGDNARGLAGLLALAAACRSADLAVSRPLTFAATVGEEGGGDLRGVKHLFEDAAFRPDAFLALDGAGSERIVHRALGSRRLRAAFKGPGGHSWAAFGVVNPAHAVGLAAAAVAELPLPAAPRSTASVVRMGGGSGLNTIPQEAWLELDLRSESETALESLSAGVEQALARAMDAANRRRTAGTPPLALEIVPLGHRPSGITDAEDGLVRYAVAATRFIGRTPALATASTDANVPISRGIPGIALGAGGRGGDAHLPSEWYENADGPAGLTRVLLVALAAAETPATA